ncbi:5874_t:CDS:2 [Acaulospora morrowiae]|uniref:5874_t:CDS:1 n=1 Tax=Acaulospora morrowiae TaxID=94023 RepID=A0A9N9BNT8_9GLOM|nr:5874_t:CDS:2 [Acaulospora morrowiae]
MSSLDDFIHKNPRNFLGNKKSKIEHVSQEEKRTPNKNSGNDSLERIDTPTKSYYCGYLRQKNTSRLSRSPKDSYRNDNPVFRQVSTETDRLTRSEAEGNGTRTIPTNLHEGNEGVTERHLSHNVSKRTLVDLSLQSYQPQRLLGDSQRMKQIELYLNRFHTQAILDAKERSQIIRKQSKSNINRYDILLRVDLGILLDFSPELGNDLLNNFFTLNLQEDIAANCLLSLRSMSNSEGTLSEQVRCKIRLNFLPELPE